MKRFIHRCRVSVKTRFLRFRDWLEVVLGLRYYYDPPKRYNYINEGNSRLISLEFFEYINDLCGLNPDHDVLEIGSGFGRMAVPYTTYLKQNGTYTGIDIIKDGVNWSKQVISEKFENFNFYHLDVYNNRYNPAGKIKAGEIQFPFDENSFDVIFLTSVFTHMFPFEISNYLDEIQRMLKPGGFSLNTFFLLDPSKIKDSHNSKGRFTFQYEVENYFVEDVDNPEFAVGYPEDFIKNLYLNSGLELIKPVLYGKWSGRENGLSFQDVIICRKH